MFLFYTDTIQIYLELFPLTINPGYGNAFKECNPQKAHTTGCIVVKELKNIHAPLEKEQTKKCIHYPADVCEKKKGINIEWAELVESKTQESWQSTNRNRV